MKVRAMGTVALLVSATVFGIVSTYTFSTAIQLAVVHTRVLVYLWSTNPVQAIRATTTSGAHG